MGISATTRERIARTSTAARRSAEAAASDRDKRNAAIAEGDAEGAGINELARISGLSPSHIERVLAADTAERQADAIDPQPEESA